MRRESFHQKRSLFAKLSGFLVPLCLLVVCLATKSAHGQQADASRVQWQTNLNRNVNTADPNSATAQDWIYSVERTSDGGSIGAGFTQVLLNGVVSFQPAVVKLNSSGIVQWHNAYNDGNSLTGRFREIIELRFPTPFATARYAAVGYKSVTLGGNTYEKVYIVLLNATGAVVGNEQYAGFTHISAAGATQGNFDTQTSAGYSIRQLAPQTGEAFGDLLIGGDVDMPNGSGTQKDMLLMRVHFEANSTYSISIGQHYGHPTSSNDIRSVVDPIYDGGIQFDGTPNGDLLGYVLGGGIWIDDVDRTDLYLIATDPAGDDIDPGVFIFSSGSPYEDAAQTADGPTPVDPNPNNIYEHQTTGDTNVNPCYANVNQTSKRDAIYDIRQLPDGKFIMAALMHRATLSCNNGLYVDAQAFLLGTEQNGDPYFSNSPDPAGYLKHVGRFSGADFNIRVRQLRGENGFVVTGTTADSPKVNTALSNMYIIRTDNEGERLWDRAVTSPSTAGSCGFGVTATEDGGFIVAGNNGFAGGLSTHDFTFIKMGPDCQTDFSYTHDYSGTTGGHQITGTENWTTNRTVKGTVRVKSGGTLTISGTSTVIQFAQSRQTEDWNVLEAIGSSLTSEKPTRIIVEPGGRLVVEDGATLRGLSGCGFSNMWDGIIVMGTYPNPAQDSSSTQTAQGIMLVHEDAVIQDAYFGASVGGFRYLADGYPKFYYGWGGGIMQVRTGGTFKDCYYGVYLLPYRSPNCPTGDPSLCPNLSYFNGGKFMTTGPLADPNLRHNTGRRLSTDSHVNMYKVYALTFRNNLFENTNDDLPTDLRSAGIFSVESTFQARPADLSVTTPADSNRFHNLSTGIFTNNLYYSEAIQISGNTFKDNFRGVYLTAGLHATVTRNHFITGTPNAPTLGGAFGMMIQGTRHFVVEENNFISRGTAGGWDYGIIASNTNAIPSSSIPVEIYNNYFEGLTYGIQSQLNNAGLQIRCNDFRSTVSTGYDIRYMSGSLFQNQGACTSGIDEEKTPAGNTFSDPCSSNNLFVNSAGSPTPSTITYNHHDPNSTSEEVKPICSSSSFIALSNCLVNYTKTSSCPSELNAQGLRENINTIIKDSIYFYPSASRLAGTNGPGKIGNSGLDPGIAKTTNSLSQSEQLLVASMHLGSGRTAQAKEALYLAYPDSVLDNYGLLFSKAIAFQEQNLTLEDAVADAGTRQLLESFATDTLQPESVIARTMLSIATGRKYEPYIQEYVATNRELSAEAKEEIEAEHILQPSVQLYPNPASNEVIVACQLPAATNHAELYLYDLLGRQIFKRHLPQIHGNNLVPFGRLDTGIYYYRVQADGKEAANGKLIIMQ